MARGTTPMKRGGKLKPGKKTLAKKAAMKMALDTYFLKFGAFDGDGKLVAHCQLSERTIERDEAIPHHKTPRSILRKEGVKDLDAPERLLILHWKVHMELHDHKMTRPTDPEKLERFIQVEQSAAHAGNGLTVERRVI